MKKYGIWLSSNQDKEGFQIPVNPSEIEIKDGLDSKTYNISKLGEINLVKGVKLKEISFESFFPLNHYPFVETDKKLSPQKYVNDIKKWMESKQPIHFIFVGHSLTINMLATIESFTTKEVSGAIGDIEYSISLKKYQPFAAKKVKIKKGKKKTTKKQKRSDTKQSPKTYKLVKGDSLWKVAKKFLGNPLRWTEIQKLNKIPTSKLRKLPIGLKIKLPPK
ncbi:LysM peptidoglycan-binding domain-containing protein [Heyndrickxia sporothermodurans]